MTTSPALPWVALGTVTTLVVTSWMTATADGGAPGSVESAGGRQAVASAPPAPPSSDASVAPSATASASATTPAATPSATKSPAATDYAPVTVAGMSACKDAKLAKATSASGKAPIQYSKGWTPGPTQGCTVTDQPGRSFKITAAQNRMIYRVNEMRAIQNKKDGKKRKILGFDFCLQELAQDYTNTRPGGHNPFLMKMYSFPGGGGAGTGSVWIGENLGAHSGYTSNELAQADRLVYNWYTSGTLTTGHYGNMMDVDWSRAGLGILSSGASVVSIQNFSADPAYYAYPGGKKCTKPPKKKYGTSTVPPIGRPPGFG